MTDKILKICFTSKCISRLSSCAAPGASSSNTKWWREEKCSGVNTRTRSSAFLTPGLLLKNPVGSIAFLHTFSVGEDHQAPLISRDTSGRWCSTESVLYIHSPVIDLAECIHVTNRVMNFPNFLMIFVPYVSHHSPERTGRKPSTLFMSTFKLFGKKHVRVQLFEN